ncbi:hypothetical protein BLA29_004017 [Euroglyphus maynei]|uniref:Phospholipase B-like n=1 Tax=Euroglyphus maynei TaxID=6958 RepID=A0A1Y3B2J8_EURMA|nr:hypothetical protein BLA29_004017 [Euroglyphus maynei]
MKSLNTTIERSRRSTDQYSYWSQIQLQLLQLAGLDHGYTGYDNHLFNHRQGKFDPDFILENIDPCGTILLHLYTEYDDLKYLLSNNTRVKNEQQQQQQHFEEHCSALIKILPNQMDVLVSHVTFANLKSMLRILKRYTLNYSTSNSKTIVMSSYPDYI